MMPTTPETSPREADRRNGRLVFRGYASVADRSRGYPVPIRQQLIAESKSLEMAEQRLARANPSNLARSPWSLEGFRIVEIHPDDPFAHMQEWFYDTTMRRTGHLVHDRRIRFAGREPSACRFSPGQLVEFVSGDCVRLGRIVELPLSPREVAAGRSHGLIIGLDATMGEAYADQSDDTYTVEFMGLDDSGPFSECLLQHAKLDMGPSP